MAKKKKKAKPKLTEAEWDIVFQGRCKSKSGRETTEAERDLMHRAYKTDPVRYAALDRPVFEATKPFGA